MRRNTLNFVVDSLALISTLGMVLTGSVIRYVLPPGSDGSNCKPRKTLWELSRHEWGELHFWVATVWGGLVLIHLAFHWSWVCGTINIWRGQKPRLSTIHRAGYFVVFLLAVVGLIVGFMMRAADSAHRAL